ncbi:hypothetical protein HDU67_002721, partial [Dinochytrium kinnereticum]
LIQAFPSVRGKVGVEMFFEGCGAISPRFFSVTYRYRNSLATTFINSSTPPPQTLATPPTHISLLVSVIDHVVGDRHFRGLASPYLENVALRGSGPVHIIPRPPGTFSIREKTFTARRWVLVANGTGVAPFLGGVQEVTARWGRDGAQVPEEVLMFHGRRWEEERGVLRGLDDIAKGDKRVRLVEMISRKAEGKGAYVQDGVRDWGKEVWGMVKDGDGALLVCGSVAMAKDLHTVLCEIAVEHSDGEITDLIAAKKFWDGLAAEGMYMRDVWG